MIIDIEEVLYEYTESGHKVLGVDKDLNVLLKSEDGKIIEISEKDLNELKEMVDTAFYKS